MALEIEVATSSGVIGRYSIDKNPKILGRSSSCDIRIPSTLTDVSSKHILLKEIAGVLYIMDGDGTKASTNGVYLNRSRIRPNNWINVPDAGIVTLGNPSKSNCVQISALTQIKSIQSVSGSTRNTSSIQNAAVSVPVQLTNSGVNVALVRPARSRSQWKTPANLLIHVIGLGICVALIPAITGSAMEAGITILIIVLFEIYFLPSVISFNRDQPNRFAILALNLFLGWTLLGWVVSLVWSLTAR